MIKRLFTLCLALAAVILSTMAQSSVTINATNFPDDIFRQFVSDNYDADHSNSLSPAELAAVTEMSVVNMGISDLKGIEYFTQLRTLDCNSNKLPSLNVTKNTALTKLVCFYNRLPSLDVTKNTELEELDCRWNSDMTSLDVTMNTKLKILRCAANYQIASLNVTKNTALEELECWSLHGLTSLDVTNNVVLKKLECTLIEGLTSLDVRNNTELTHLRCQATGVTSLDISKNKKLKYLECGPDITSLDVSKNTNLEELVCLGGGEGKLTSLTLSPNLTSLKTINLRSNKIMGNNMTALVNNLPTVSGGTMHIKWLFTTRHDNIITAAQVAVAKSKGWSVMAHGLNGDEEWPGEHGVQPTLQNFPDENFFNYLHSQPYCDDGYITDEELATLKEMDVSSKSIKDLTGIEHFTALKTLNCSSNQLTSLNVSKNTALINLVCYTNQLTTLNVSNNTKLKFLNCDNNQLKSLNVLKNTALTSLYCRNNQLTSLDVTKNTALTNLYCSGNSLSSLDVSKNTAMVELLCSSNSLTSLDVSQNPSLGTLYCQKNNIRGTAMTNFINSLPTRANSYGYLYLLHSTGESNTITSAQVKTAISKAWKVFRYNGSAWEIYNDVQINSANFPDEKFREFVKQYDKDNSGTLTGTELAAVTSMNVKDKGIKDLKGIEYFSELTYLVCGKNSLTSLDVSLNKALTELYCYENSLTSLDVSKNKKLKILSCYLNTGLTSLDVSKNTALEKLYCRGNNLTSLDVSKNTALTYLSCRDNQLTSLDISKNTQLTELYCYNNSMTSLNVSGATTLKLLSCYENSLTSLDVSKNTALEELYCYGNSLTSLDVSKNTALKKLSCYRNNISGAAMTYLVCGLADRVATDGAVFKVCSNNANQDNNIATIQVKIAKNHGWTVQKYNGTEWVDYAGETYISIMNKYFPDDNFCNYLRSQPYGDDGFLTESEIAGVTEMDVSNKGITDLTGIDYFTALTNLNCSNNSLESLDVSANTALTVLNCSNNSLGTLDVSANTALTKLSCGSNSLTSLDVSQNTQLIELNCYKNKLTSLDVSANTRLSTLRCYENQISGKAMSDLINSLPTRLNSPGYMYVVKRGSSPDNVITTAQVQMAREKGWNVYERDGNGSTNYTGVSGVEINATNFPGENFRNYLLAQEYGADGLVSDEELATVTELVFSDTQIGDLTGIGYFSALKKLYCGGCGLTSLDVSKNRALTYLSCRDNQLTSLDVSQNTQLTELLCYKNELESLNVSGATALQTLSCYENKLKSLDVSGATALTYLTCRDNQLTSLDVSQNTQLTELNCYKNKLTSLDVSGATALKKLSCYGNSLSSLDVSKNTALEELSCYDNGLTSLDVSKNTALTYLSCYGTGLTSLDVSNNTALTYLSCHDNQLTSLDVSENTNLTNLYCYNNSLEELDVSANTNLKILNCYGNNLSSLDVSKIGTLVELHCYENNMTSLTVSKTKNTALKILSCYKNNIRVAAMTSLVNSLPTRANNDGIFRVFHPDTEGTDNIITTTLVREARSRGWKVYKYDGSSWVVYNGVSDVEINATNFPDDKFREYLLTQPYGADGLISYEELQTVTRIEVYGQPWGYYGITDLTGIGYFTELTYLNCGFNALTALDVSANTKLLYLYCNCDGLTSLDLSANTALQYLDCYANSLASLDVSANTQLQWLRCGNNDLTSLDLSTNTALNYLECECNAISGAAMTSLVASLPERPDNDGQLNVCGKDLGNGSENVISAAQVAAARAKGWTVKILVGSDWTVYDGVSDIEINATNFPDEVFRNYLLGQPYGADGLISYEELQTVTRIDVAGSPVYGYYGITDLTGIGYFTELTYLDCGFNALTALDVSANTKLLSLNCICTGLTSLDLSANTALRSLECYANRLESLDVSANTQLEWLRCGDNDLTSLDLPESTALYYLECEDNAISGDAMASLVASLPERPDNDGQLNVCGNERGNGGDNVITAAQVAAASAKGWTVKILVGSDWTVYGGQGDVNCDGMVTVTDAALTIEYAETKVAPAGFDVGSADMDGNNDVTKADAVMILDTVLKE